MKLTATSRAYTLALALLLTGITALAGALIHTLRTQQQLATDLAALNDVEYGLLSADAWIVQLTALLEKQIDSFELTADNRPALKASLERMLTALIDEAERQLDKPPAGRTFWERFESGLIQNLSEALVDTTDLRRDIPAYADRILAELNKPRAREEMKAFAKNLLSDASDSTFSTMDRSELEAVHARHGCADRAGCTQAIQPRIDAAQSLALRQALVLLGLCTLLFLLVARAPRSPGRLALLAGCCAVLMLCGVLTPMIEIEARITELSFVLLGEPVVFTDQVLYFQSKSVLDVVAVLAQTGKPEMILVSALLILFSVIFPLAKLAASMFYLYAGSRTKLVDFFALKSGKWSMADVFVVAMFMGFIGFRGLASNQLGEIADAGGPGVEVLTTNGTSLEIGFFMFLAFCIASLVTSTLIESAPARAAEL